MSGVGVYGGVFWLPNEPQRRVFGTLDISNGTPTLDLVDDLVGRWEPGEVRQPGGDDTRVTAWRQRSIGPDVERFTIHGEIIDPRRNLTLLECFTRGHGDGQNIQASCALVGGHTSPEIKVSEARFGLPYLDEWAQVAEMSGSRSDERIEVVYRPAEPRKVDLSGPLPCALELSVEVHEPRVTWTSVQIDVQASLTFKDLQDVPLTAVWWGVAAISEIYTLAIDTEARPTRLEIFDSANEVWFEVIDPRIVAEPEDRSPDKLRKILLFRRDGDMQIFADWIGGYERLRPIPAVVVRSMRNAGNILEVQLFDLASAAEGFHRRQTDDTRTSLFDKTAERAVRKAAREAAGDNEYLAKAVLDALGHIGKMSYDERLSWLLDAAVAGMPDISGWACAMWKTRVKEARNGLAHRLPSYPGMPWSERWREELVILKSLRWLMTTLLLLEAGIESATLARRLGQHEPYRIFMEQAREWLPEVFPAATTAV